MAIKEYISKKDFETQYYVNQKTYMEIAQMSGCSTQQIANLAKKYKITPRKAKPRLKETVLVGQKFGKLTVLGGTVRALSCQCECGSLVKRAEKEMIRPGMKMCNECKKSFISAINWKGYEEISGDVWSRIVSSAKRRKLDLCVDIEYCWNVFIKQTRKCALSGVDISFARSRRQDEITASLDRIDSSKGYIKGNIQWVHKNINRMKLDTPVTEFIRWCSLVSKKNQ